MPYHVPQIIRFVSRVAHFLCPHTRPRKANAMDIRINPIKSELSRGFAVNSFIPTPHFTPFLPKTRGMHDFKSIVPSVILCFLLSSQVLQSPRLRLETSQLRKHCKDGTPRKDESGRVSWTIPSRRRRAASATHTSVDRCHCQG